MTNGYQNPYFRAMMTPFPSNQVAFSTKTSLDQALINYWGHDMVSNPQIDKDFNLEYEQQGFPKMPLRFIKNLNLMTGLGSFFFYIPIALSFLIVITEMLQEKARKIKDHMVSAGMSISSYWLSWMLFA